MKRHYCKSIKDGKECGQSLGWHTGVKLPYKCLKCANREKENNK